MKVAILLTCFNRKSQTLNCLKNMQLSIDDFQKYKFDAFLVDDGSSDGTSEAVKLNFPEINIILGNGNLYWNQGMRLAWKTAIEKHEYNFYIWLNDDTLIDENGISHLFECYFESYKDTGDETIITGACRNDTEGKFSYGGRTDVGPVFPSGRVQDCKYINGNFVLIPKKIIADIGILSNDYTHAMGDFDFGLSALRNGYNLATTKRYVATCPNNIGIPIWCNPQVHLMERWKHFHSPLGLNIQEYKIFVKKNWPINSFRYILKAYVKCLIPTIYHKLSNYAK